MIERVGGLGVVVVKGQPVRVMSWLAMGWKVEAEMMCARWLVQG